MRQSSKGFTLIVAIWLLLAMTGMMAIMLSFSSQTVDQTATIYVREQAQLLSKSATEYALLSISAHDRTIGLDCVNYINSTFSPNGSAMFDINTTIKYIGLAPTVTGICEDLPGAEGSVANPIFTESQGMFLIDTYVTAKDAIPGKQSIRYHRRTLQKP